MRSGSFDAGFKVARSLMILIAVACCGGQNACSFILDTDAKQCSVDDDCAGRGPQFAGYICSPEQQVCIRKQGFCKSNQECLSRFNGQPAVCQANACINLLNDDCSKLVGNADDLKNDNTVVLGLMLPIAGNPLAPQGLSSIHSVQLALTDWTNVVGGLPAATQGGSSRPVVYVACNEFPDAARSATHLVKDIHVPAMIGPLSSAQSLTAVNQVLVPNGVLTILPVASTYALTSVKDKSLVWRLGAGDIDFITAIADVASKVEGDLRAANVVTDPNGMKAAFYHRGDILGTTAQPLMLQQLNINTKDGPTNQAQGTYQDINYGDAKDQQTLAAAQQSLLTFQPHAVMLWGSGEIYTVATNVEKAWTAAAYRPRYLFHPAGQGGKWSDFVGTNEELRKRIFGVSSLPEPSDPIYAAWLGKYNASFASDTTAQISNATPAYFDAVYLLHFALSALGSTPITGANVAAAMKKFQPLGTKIDPRLPGNIQNGLVELQAGRPIDYVGAVGEVIFDTNGDFNPRPTYIWCISPAATGNKVQRTGWTLNPTTHKLDGTNTCFN